MNPPKIRTYLDACVLLTAWKGQEMVARKALGLMEDGRRTMFAASSVLKLELLPLPQYNGNHNEVAFYETFFHQVTEWQEVNESLLREALNIAGRHGLHAMDGLHLAAAIAMEVDEFITDEKPTKPIYRVKTPKVVALSTL